MNAEIAGRIGTDKPKKARVRSTFAHQLAKLDQQIKRARSARARAEDKENELVMRRDALIREAKAIAETLS